MNNHPNLKDILLTKLNSVLNPQIHVKIIWGLFVLGSMMITPKLIEYLISLELVYGDLVLKLTYSQPINNVLSFCGVGFVVISVLLLYHFNNVGTKNISSGAGDKTMHKILARSTSPKYKGDTVDKKHVFLSYCYDNRKEVASLRQDLIAAGEAVWWDQDILAGQDWRFEIRNAMKNAYAVVLCLSKEAMNRNRSGIYPEAYDAIQAYREYAPGQVYLIPVRLSECEIPMVEIDSTRSLDRLQCVDLFPPSKRKQGVEILASSIKSATSLP